MMDADCGIGFIVDVISIKLGKIEVIGNCLCVHKIIFILEL